MNKDTIKNFELEKVFICVVGGIPVWSDGSFDAFC